MGAGGQRAWLCRAKSKNCCLQSQPKPLTCSTSVRRNSECLISNTTKLYRGEKEKQIQREIHMYLSFKLAFYWRSCKSSSPLQNTNTDTEIQSPEPLPTGKIYWPQSVWRSNKINSFSLQSVSKLSFFQRHPEKMDHLLLLCVVWGWAFFVLFCFKWSNSHTSLRSSFLPQHTERIV